VAHSGAGCWCWCPGRRGDPLCLTRSCGVGSIQGVCAISGGIGMGLRLGRAVCKSGDMPPGRCWPGVTRSGEAAASHACGRGCRCHAGEALAEGAGVHEASVGRVVALSGGAGEPSRRTRSLPAELTSFVGRRREIAQLTSRVATHRLVTLTGPGGSGKSRLALRVAAGSGGSVHRRYVADRVGRVVGCRLARGGCLFSVGGT